MERDATPLPRPADAELVHHLWEALHGPLSRAAGHGRLRLETEEEARTRAAVLELEDGLARCLESLEEELELSQLSEDSPAPPSVRFALDRVIGLTLRAVAPRARARGVVLRARIDPDLALRFRGVSRRVELCLRAWLREELAGARRGVATLTARVVSRTQRSARVRFELSVERRRRRPQLSGALSSRPALTAKLLRDLGGVPADCGGDGRLAIELPLALDEAI